MSPTPPNQPPPGWGPDPQQGGWQPPEQQGGWVPPDQQGGWQPPAGPPPGAPGYQDPNAGWGSAPGFGTPPPGMGGPGTAKKSSPVVPIVVLVVVLIAAAVGAFLVLGGDDDEGSGPETALRSYVTAANDQDCGAMIDAIDLDDAGGTRDELVSRCETTFQDATDDDIAGNIPEALESAETVSEEGDNATLAVTYRMADGSTPSDEIDFVRIDGEWKIVSSSMSLETGEPDPTTTSTTAEPSTTSTTEESTTTTADDTTTTTSGSTEELPFGIGQGTPEQLAPYRDACANGDMAACDDLWYGAPSGSEEEDFAETCGGLDPAGGHIQTCESDYG